MYLSIRISSNISPASIDVIDRSNIKDGKRWFNLLEWYTKLVVLCSFADVTITECYEIKLKTNNIVKTCITFFVLSEHIKINNTVLGNTESAVKIMIIINNTDFDHNIEQQWYCWYVLG